MGLQDDLTLKIRQMAAANEAEAAKGPAEVKADRTMELYNEYLVAKETKESAPGDYTQALNKYLVSRDGPEAVLEAHQRRAAGVARERLSKFRASTKEVLEAVALYDTVSTAAIRGHDAYVKQLQDYSDELDAASLLEAEKNTSERKSYYLRQVNDRTETWDGLLTVYIVALAVVFTKQIIVPNSKSPFAWLVLALLLASSYLLPRLLGALLSIKPAMSVYTTWVQPNPIWTGSTLHYEGTKTGIVV